MDHPDFRVSGKIFATLGYPDMGWGVILLTPDQQAEFILTNPKGFSVVKGGWGKAGATQVLLRASPRSVVHDALRMAWRNRASRKLLAELGE